MRALPLGLLMACAAPRATPNTPPAATFIPRSIDEAEFRDLHEALAHPTPARGQAIDVAGGRGYLSLPPGLPPGAALAGLVVIPEAAGLDDHAHRWADRLAAEGYATLAIDAPVLPRLLAALEFLARDPKVQAKRRGAVGLGAGGALALELVMAAPHLDAAALYYGPPTVDAARLRSIRARLFGVYGTRDQDVRPEDVRAFDRAARDAGVSLVIERYDAAHAFANPSDPRYDEAAAADAWLRVRSFLREALR